MHTADTFHSRLQSLLYLLVLAAAPVLAVDTQFMQGLGDTRYHHLEFEVVGRGYHLYVMLPDNYDSDDSMVYPTVYVLDGGGLSPLFSAYYRYLNFSEEIPDVIIVAISYGTDDFAEGVKAVSERRTAKFLGR